MKKVILFDMDGTLTESGEGIIKSVQYALGKMGKTETDMQKLRVFIGPPLLEQFMAYADVSREEAERAVSYYRERYTAVGIFENKPYPGIPEMLEVLKKNGFLLAVASSKTEESVLRILEHFHMREYFDEVIGAELNGGRSKKAEVIEEALRRFGMSSNREQVIMVGDKEHDVFGAKEAGISCVTVAYGYGTIAELEKAGSPKIVHTVQELQEYLLSPQIRDNEFQNIKDVSQ